MRQLFPHLAQRLFNVPLALHPQKAEVALAALGDRLGVSHVARAVQAFDDDLGFAEPGRDVAGYEVQGGVAMIQLEGTLVMKTGTLQPYSGMTGYDGIRHNFLQAISDPEVRGIALDINSPGGEVSGCFDLADTIYACRGIKPIWAILGDSAYSAAYALACACDRITVPRTGGTGSIGVIMMMVDMSRALTASGLAVHFVKTGDLKAAEMRAEAQGVSKELLERLQVDIDEMGALFFSTVARNRNMQADDIQALQGGYFLGEAGVRAGLADAVMAPDEAFEALLTSLD